jgi:hypothetical protein
MSETKQQRLARLEKEINDLKLEISNENKDNKEIAQEIKKVITPTGEYDEDKDRADTYAKAFKMDAANARVLHIMTTQGPDAAMKAMLSDTTPDGQPLSYAEMRSRYG